MNVHFPRPYEYDCARRAFVTLASVLLALTAGHPAIASIYDATPDENGTLEPALITTVATHNASTVAGIFLPGPLGTAAESTAIATDVLAKHTAPVFQIPALTGKSFSEFPNATATPASGGTPTLGAANCVFQFGTSNLPRLNDDHDRGISEEYASIFGYNYDPLDNVFSDLGAPTVWHPQADVTVSVSNQYLGGSTDALQLRPEFPEGRHLLSWSAETKFNPITDVGVPVALMATFSAAEAYLARQLRLVSKSRKAAEKSAHNAFILFNLAAELGLTEGDVTNTGEAYQWYRDTSVVGARNTESQTFTVWDVHTPYFIDSADLPVTPFSRGGTIEEQVIEVEAMDFGGVKFDRVDDLLRARLEPVDDCGKQFTVSTNTKRSDLLAIGVPNIVEWSADEVNGGPYLDVQPLAANQTLDNGQIRTVLTQRITVVDTQAPILIPPAGFARYDEDGIDLTAGGFPLGRARVVDLADPSPTVTNNAPNELAGPPDGADGVRYEITWDAVDDSTNSALANSVDPARFVQTITLKRPGTNGVPNAEADPVVAVTARAVDVWLRGIDTDLIDGRVDPLDFKIADAPGHGQFEAPDYPFFIEDFRLTPVGEREEGDNLTRVSPLLHLADRFRLALPERVFPDDGSEIRGTLLNQEICTNPTSESQAAFGGVIPTNFVYRPTYVYVDNDGNFLIRDNFFSCAIGVSTEVSGLQRSGEMSVIPRLSKWSPEGELLETVTLVPIGLPDLDSVDCIDRSTAGNDGYYGLPGGSFTVDHTGRIWMGFETTNIVIGFGRIFTHCSIAKELDEFRFHGSSSADGVTIATDNVSGPIVGDLNADVLYQATPGDGVIVRNSNLSLRLWSIRPEDMVGILDDSELDSIEFSDIKVDSNGNVIVLETNANRLHKWLPSKKTAPDTWELGEYVGWMGSCTTNQTDPDTGVPYNRCDEQKGISRGFACTDRTCNRAINSSGAAQGQFNLPASIEIDPNNVIYIADTENSRVQRFSSEGTFAGEAKSTGSGVNQGDEPGFVLGNMGKPRQLSVNSNAFFVMEPYPADGDEFVHAFSSVPFREVTDSSAMVRYISDFNFQGADSFSFIVDDGIDKSIPAVVDISVSRDFNAPEKLRFECFEPGDLVNPVSCSLPEDGALYVRLSASDRDGFISDFPNGLDTLTFNVAEPPQFGRLELDDPSLKNDNATTFLYTPNADFFGNDSFVFTAADEFNVSAEQVAVEFQIVAQADPVAIDTKDSVTAARGFARLVSAEYSDVDKDPDYEPGTVRISWGDGVVAQASGWENSGNFDLNEREIDPKIQMAVNEGLLIGSHRYDSVGNFSLQFEMSNPASGATIPNTLATTAVSVIDATVVSATLNSPQAAIDPVVPFSIEIDIENLVPDGWDGLSAGNVRVSIDIPDGLLIASVDSRCSNATPIECNLGDLSQGESTSLSMLASVPLEEARQETDYMLMLEMFDDGPNVVSRNLSVANIGVADADGDGVIDFDDAFPDDANFSADTDGDGIADQWELDHGYNPLIADDANSDTDGDGFSLLDEFSNRSFPELAEREAALAGQAVGVSNTLDDRFGLSVAGGDLNQDGYADVVIGAPQGGASNGAVYIQYGAEGGAVNGFKEITPVGITSAYGRAVAVGDWDDNGYPDLAVSHSNGVYIHFNNGEILRRHDTFRNGFIGWNFGSGLHSADLDADGIEDLIATAVSDTAEGYVYAWLSTRDGLDGNPLIVRDPSGPTSDSVSVGDIDGDDRPDLIVGSPAAPAQDVQVYLGAHNDWLTVDNTTVTRSFTLATPGSNSPFGFRVASGEDIGGDGIDDLVVAAYGNVGEIYIYDSASNWIPPFGSTVAVNPDQVITGLDDGSAVGDTSGDQFGVSMALGHLDSDAYADLIVGGNRGGTSDQGQVRIFRGSPSGLLSNEQVEAGTTDFDMLGYSVAIPGDIDGDGFNDAVAGAPDIVANGRPAPDGGYAQIYYHAFVATNAADDPDTDGVASNVDNCPLAANTNQSDIDSDGQGDACDADIDGDGTTNDLDNCPLISSNDHTDLDEDGAGDVCDDDDDGDGVLDTSDAFPRDDRYSLDTDSDGLPDAYETDNGLDPNDATDGQGDLDGDGRNNLDEFTQGTDVNADDVAPILAVPNNIVINSSGPFTIVDIGTAVASDTKDGALGAVADVSNSFVPGRHVVTWTTADAAGNSTAATQTIDVIPLLDFDGAASLALEGESAQIGIVLNGDAAEYPVTVPYTISGTAVAGDDYPALPGMVEIQEGRIAVINVPTTGDGIADDGETIVLRFGQLENAVVGASNEFTLTIREGNVAPRVSIGVIQGSTDASVLTQDGGLVDIIAFASDRNQPTALSFDWSASSAALLQSGVTDSEQFSIDPNALAIGTHRLEVTVQDDGIPALSTTMHRYLRVIETAAPLSDSTDTDRDGMNDLDEGAGDENANGVSDYLDPTNQDHLLVARTGTQDLLQVMRGQQLRLGAVALASGDDAELAMSDIELFGNSGEPAAGSDDIRFRYPGGLYDFEITNLVEPGDSVLVVIPQTAPIPPAASYRKYVSWQGWTDFIRDTRNELMSAPGDPGVCPSPGSTEYGTGLTAGHFCVQLLLEDGGPNDADGATNGEVRDPGGVAMEAVAIAVTAEGVTTPSRTVNAGATNVVVARFQINVNSPDVEISSINLKASGSGDDSADISNVQVWVDANADGAIDAGDTVIGNGRFQANDGTVLLQLATPYMLQMGQSNFMVTYDF